MLEGGCSAFEASCAGIPPRRADRYQSPIGMKFLRIVCKKLVPVPVIRKDGLLWRPANNFLKAVESESPLFRAKAADKPSKIVKLFAGRDTITLFGKESFQPDLPHPPNFRTAEPLAVRALGSGSDNGLSALSFSHETLAGC
jgi:hypothetical protein